MSSISVIMTFYNENPVQLNRSVDSILNQKFQDFEFIIVAGNPENAIGIETVRNKSLANNKIQFHVGEIKLPMTVCLNRAIRLAKSKYIALQEADDESLPSRLEREFGVMESMPDIDIIGTAIAYINESDKKILVKRFYPEHPRKAFNKFTAIGHPTILVKRELYEKYGYYRESEDVRNSPDYELWFRWLVQGVKFYNIPEVHFNYYQSADNGRNRNAKKTLESVVRLKKQYASRLNFDFSDYMYYYMERLLLTIPQALISKLFYIWIKISR